MRSLRRYSSLPAALGLFLCGVIVTWLMSGHFSRGWIHHLNEAVNTAPQVTLRNQVAGLLKAQPWNRPELNAARTSVVHANLPIATMKADVRVLPMAAPTEPVIFVRSRAITYEPADAEANPAFRPEPALRPPKSC